MSTPEQGARGQRVLWCLSGCGGLQSPLQDNEYSLLGGEPSTPADFHLCPLFLEVCVLLILILSCLSHRLAVRRHPVLNTVPEFPGV